MKKFTSLMLAVLMTLSMVVSPAMAENSCTHSNIQTGGHSDILPIRYQQNSAGVHIALIDYEEFDLCLDCGETFNRTTGTRQQEEAHNFSDGTNTCANCGFVDDHSETEHHSYDVDESIKYSNISLLYHTRSIEHVDEDYCVACHQTFNRVVNTRVDENVRHFFGDDNVCDECGYVNTCTHANTRDESGYMDMKYTEIPGDNKHHTMTGTFLEIVRCENCQVEVSVKEHPNHTEQGWHNYNGTDTCIDCSHKNTCAHTNCDEGIGFEDAKYAQIPGDNTNHEVSGIKVEIKWCFDCDQEVYCNVIGQTTETEHHYYVNGECEQCGYVNACAHENCDEGIGFEDAKFTQIPGDNTNHEISGIKVEIKWCPDCEHEVSKNVIGQATETERHNYVNGECEQCGYVNACAHENAEEGIGFEDAKFTQIPGDNTFHEISGIKVEIKWCPDCEQEVYRNVIGQTTETENHYYQNGVCEQCGYVNTCAHEEHIVEWGFNDAQYTALNAQEHEVVGTKFEFMWCFDCDSEIYYTETPNATGTESHNYVSGVCEQCGYVNTCKHENIEEGWGFADATYTPISGDNINHKVTGTKIEEKWCTDCGEQVELIETHNVTETEPHNYADGVCEMCGHVNTCKHENTEDFQWYDNATYTAVSGNDKQHSATGTFVSGTWCLDCEHDVVISMQDNVTGMEDHSWVDDVCEFCGYALPAVKPTTAPTVAPEVSNAPTAAPTTAPTAAPTEAPANDTPAVEAQPTTAPSLSQSGSSATLAKPEAEVIIQAADGSTTVTKIDSNTAIEVVELVTGEDGYLWFEVNVGTDTGLVRGDAIAMENVEIPGTADVLSEEENKTFTALPVTEQMMVILNVLNPQTANEGEENKVVLSAEATALIETINTRLAETGAADKTAALRKIFPSVTVEVDGVKVEYIVIPMQITAEDGTVTTVYYGFTVDSETGLYTIARLNEEDVVVSTEE